METQTIPTMALVAQFSRVMVALQAVVLRAERLVLERHHTEQDTARRLATEVVVQAPRPWVTLAATALILDTEVRGERGLHRTAQVMVRQQATGVADLVQPESALRDLKALAVLPWELQADMVQPLLAPVTVTEQNLGAM